MKLVDDLIFYSSMLCSIFNLASPYFFAITRFAVLIFFTLISSCAAINKLIYDCTKRLTTFRGITFSSCSPLSYSTS